MIKYHVHQSLFRKDATLQQVLLSSSQDWLQDPRFHRTPHQHPLLHHAGIRGADGAGPVREVLRVSAEQRRLPHHLPACHVCLVWQQWPGDPGQHQLADWSLPRDPGTHPDLTGAQGSWNCHQHQRHHRHDLGQVQH